MASYEEPLANSQGLTALTSPLQMFLHPATVCTVAVATAITVASLAASMLFDPASVAVKSNQSQTSANRAKERQNLDVTVSTDAPQRDRSFDEQSLGPSRPPSSSLIDPGSSEGINITTEVGGSTLLAWGLMGVSCAVGCLLISRGFARKAIALETASESKWGFKTRSSKHSSTTLLPRRGRRANPNYPESEVLEADVVSYNFDQTEDQTGSNWSSVETQTDSPLVTVLPPDAVHPLDWGENSLAYQLDIRKEQPISFWT